MCGSSSGAPPTIGRSPPKPPSGRAGGGCGVGMGEVSPSVSPTPSPPLSTVIGASG